MSGYYDCRKAFLMLPSECAIIPLDDCEFFTTGEMNTLKSDATKSKQHQRLLAFNGALTSDSYKVSRYAYWEDFIHTLDEIRAQAVAMQLIDMTIEPWEDEEQVADPGIPSYHKASD